MGKDKKEKKEKKSKKDKKERKDKDAKHHERVDRLEKVTTPCMLVFVMQVESRSCACHRRKSERKS